VTAREDAWIRGLLAAFDEDLHDFVRRLVTWPDFVEATVVRVDALRAAGASPQAEELLLRIDTIRRTR
jgi:hypothetical protein